MKSVAKFPNESVETISKTTKGYKGYEKPKVREKTDKKFRELISSTLDTVAERLPDSNGNVQKTDKSLHKKSLYRINQSLKTIINSLKNPCYCNQSFFDKPHISSDQLKQLYEYDLDLKGQIDILNDESKQLKSIKKEDEISAALNHIYDIIDGVNQVLTEREFLIMSIVEVE